MIKANELRIGNYVHVGEMLTAPITSIIPELCNAYEPVVLTPEILLACGFDIEPQKPKTWYKFFKREHDENYSSVFIGQLDEDPSGMYYSGFSSPTSWVNINNIYHLHQLQNLYFALTGQELTVNLPV